MDIIIDSREKAKAITNIIAEFDRQGIKYASSKLFVGDYQSLDNPRYIIDRKQNLNEICGNVTQQHKRFAAEMLRAKEMGIKLVFLIEHSPDIKCLEDVKTWRNPRINQYCFILKKQLVLWGDYNEWYLYKYAKEQGLKPRIPPTSGEQLYKTLSTIQTNYDTQFLFCSKAETGKRIIELLGGGGNG